MQEKVTINMANPFFIKSQNWVMFAKTKFYGVESEIGNIFPLK